MKNKTVILQHFKWVDMKLIVIRLDIYKLLIKFYLSNIIQKYKFLNYIKLKEKNSHIRHRGKVFNGINTDMNIY